MSFQKPILPRGIAVTWTTSIMCERLWNWDIPMKHTTDFLIGRLMPAL
jgi:hypothetical protein